ncbi:MAG: hemolysin III family protein [Rhodospirillaceae bacterium]|nr:hemolysin III family protein [Rhodospirillaceae bacterium]
MSFQENAGERKADAAIHGVGVAFGIVAVAALAVLAIDHVRTRDLVSLGLYAFGLFAMLTCSALYNLARNGRHADMLRRVDHAVIYVMIAGTYSPIAVMAVGGARGGALFAFVWVTALVGAALKLLLPHRFERLSLVLWLALGWTVLAVIQPLRESMAPTGLLLLGAGCLLYSIGVIFHLWRRLPYHNAIWHGFVLAAAACHYMAVVGLTAAHTMA